MLGSKLGSVFDIRVGTFFTNGHSSLCLPPQVPPAPNGQPEGHQEDIPPPVRGFARLGGMQDPRHLDVAYQGVVDYHPQQLLGVSSSHLSSIYYQTFF